MYDKHTPHSSNSNVTLQQRSFLPLLYRLLNVHGISVAVGYRHQLILTVLYAHAVSLRG